MTVALQQLTGPLPLAALAKTEFGFRLTLQTATPVPTSDQASASTVYLTPYTSNAAWLEYGGVVRRYQLSELSLAIGTVTTSIGHDVFLQATSETAAQLVKLAWTSATARATALARDGAGRWCLSGDTTKLYVGSFYSTSTTVTDDTAAKRFLWNFYNRVSRSWNAQDSTASYTANTGGTSTYAAPNGGNAAWKREFFRGLDEDPVIAIAVNHSDSSPNQYALAFGVDSTTAISTAGALAGFSVPPGAGGTIHGHFCGLLGLGYHYLSAIEATSASSTIKPGASGRRCGTTGACLS